MLKCNIIVIVRKSTITHIQILPLNIPLAPGLNGTSVRETVNKILYIMYMSEVGTVNAVLIFVFFNIGVMML